MILLLRAGIFILDSLNRNRISEAADVKSLSWISTEGLDRCGEVENRMADYTTDAVQGGRLAAHIGIPARLHA